MLFPVHKKTVFVVFLLIACGFQLKAQSTKQSLQKADSFIQKGQEAPALSIYQQIIKIDSSQRNALVQASILTIRKGNRLPPKKDPTALYQQAEQLARSAVKADPDFAPADYAMGLSLYFTAQSAGVKEKIRRLKEVKVYLDRALLLDSTYAPVWHLSGQWNLAFTNMNFAERAATKILFGGMSKAGVDPAIADFKKCKQLKPSFILNYYHLAQAYHIKGKDLTAIATLKEAISLRPILQDDRDIQEKCKKMIDKLQ